MILWLLFACSSQPEPTPPPCGDLSGSACAASAESQLGTDDAQTLREARLLLDDACERLADPSACELLGRSLLSRGARPLEGEPVTGAASAFGKGVEYLDRACELGGPEACYKLGQLTMRGVGLPSDLGRARRWFASACDGGHLEGCIDSGVLAEFGKGGEADVDLALARYKTACDGGHGRGCTKLGLMLRDGKAVEAQPEQGVTWLRKGCELGFAPGCGLASISYRDGLVPSDPEAQWGLAVDAVVLGDATAATWIHNASNGLPASVAPRLQGMASACEGGNAAACLVWAGEQARAGTGEALTGYQRACQADLPAACGHVARIAEDVVLAEGGIEVLATLHERGCEGKLADSCLWLARAYETGRGVEISDRPAAIAAFERACALGSKPGCEGSERLSAVHP